MKLNSHNEWDRLLEVIVGTARGSCPVLTWMKKEPVPQKDLQKAIDLYRKVLPRWYLDEIEEDLEGLVQILIEFGAKVHRPQVHDLSHRYSNPFWQSTGNNLHNVRDLHLVVGNRIIESPSHMRSRYFEPMALHDIWSHYFEEGCTWICGPKPKLDEEILEPYALHGDNAMIEGEETRYRELTKRDLEPLQQLKEKEILFEAANVVRLGKDLLYLISSSGNEKGGKWLQTVLGDTYRVHANRDIYHSSHIDSTVIPLRQGLVMLNSLRVNEMNCPEIFRN